MGKPIVISVVGDTRDLISGLDRSESRLGKFGKVAKVGLLGVAAGFVGAGAAGVQFAKNAIADEAAQRRLAIALRNTSGATKSQIAATEDWISKQGVALGVTDDALRPALNTLVTATRDVGKAQTLASLAMDISAGTGKDLSVVSMALAKAQNGNVSSLGRLGLKVKDSEGKTKSLAEVTRDLSNTYKGQASAAANSLEGKFGRLQLMLDETGETIGAALLPPLTTATTWILSKGVPAVGRFGTALKSRLQPVFLSVKSAVSQALPVFAKISREFLSQALPAITQFATAAASKVIPVVRSMASLFVNKFLPAAQSIATFITTKVLPTVIRLGSDIATKLQPVFNQLAATFQTSVIPTVSKVVDKFREAQPTLEKIVMTAIKVQGTFLKIGAAIVGKVLPPLIRFAGFLIANVVPAAASVVIGIAKVISTVITVGNKFVEAGTKASNFASKIISKITEIPSKIGSGLTYLKQLGIDLIQGFINGIIQKAGEIVSTIQSYVIDKIPGPIKKALGISSPSKVMKGFGRNIVEGLVIGIKDESPNLTRTIQALSADASQFSATPGGFTITPKISSGVATAGRVYEINVTVAPTASPIEVGRQVVAAIAAFEGAGGRRRA